MDAPMPTRLSLLTVLLLLAALLMASAAHGASLPVVPDLLSFEESEPLDAEAEEEGEEATECDLAYEEADEGTLSEAEAEEICEEDAEAQPAAKSRGKAGSTGSGAKHTAKQRAQRRKKACRHRASPRKKRHCPRGPRRR